MISICINIKMLHGNRTNPRDSQSYMSDEILSLTSIQKHTNSDSKVCSRTQMCTRSLIVSTDDGLKKIWDQRVDAKLESAQC